VSGSHQASGTARGIGNPIATDESTRGRPTTAQIPAGDSAFTSTRRGLMLEVVTNEAERGARE
jgi:hypothetical protein